MLFRLGACATQLRGHHLQEGVEWERLSQVGDIVFVAYLAITHVVVTVAGESLGASGFEVRQPSCPCVGTVPPWGDENLATLIYNEKARLRAGAHPLC
jgi:hypothetical protein